MRRMVERCGWLGLFVALVWGCNATPLPTPPSVDPGEIDMFPGKQGQVVLRGGEGAVHGDFLALRATGSGPASEAPPADDGSFTLVINGTLDEVFYLEGILPVEDVFLVAIQSAPGGSAMEVDPGPDSDADGSPDSVDCAPMNPLQAGQRCVPLCDAEICDMRDNDCDGMVDEGCTGGCINDGDCALGSQCLMNTCVPIACMTSAECPPGLLCRLTDNRCGPRGDDADGDGYPAPADCADGDPAVHPDAPELCDLIDNDCNGMVDEACMGASCMTDAECPVGARCLMSSCMPTPCMTDTECAMGAVCNAGVCGAARRDIDGDGVSPPADCDDNNAAVRPGIAEVCGDMLDNDCDGALDNGCGMAMCALDSDCPFTFFCVGGNCQRRTCMILADCPMGATCVGFECQPTSGMDGDGDGFAPPEDCDDTNGDVSPGDPERCFNMLDDDCDGIIDEMDCTPM
ncbi:MAG: putative metal-binding motif-containing protein [Myxococcota bacterium]